MSSYPHIRRAYYDAEGNIILEADAGRGEVTRIPILREEMEVEIPVAISEPALRPMRTEEWLMLDEEEFHEPEPMLTAPEPKPILQAPKIERPIEKKVEPMIKIPKIAEPPKPSTISKAKTQAKRMVEQSVEESRKQFSETISSVYSEFSDAKLSLKDLPARLAQKCKHLWQVGQTPVQLPKRKAGKRPPKKVTLFLMDTVRFGGTFGLIFAVLFVGINYQSFWQIARAQLAIGSDITTEQGLDALSRGARTAALSAKTATMDNTNILAYLPAVGPSEDRIIIPKIGKNVPIVRPSMDALMKEDWKQFEDDIQTALHDGVVHYPGSAKPGQAGNFFVTGHSSYYPWDNGSYKDVFARLHELEPGDTYSVYYGGDRHTYRITRKYEVKPSNVNVLDQPTDRRIATLMTCTPIGTTLRRLIVEAEEIDPQSGDVLKVGERPDERPENPFGRLEALPI
jgi:LPXTG-site transpeptidase (sortase) family protein